MARILAVCSCVPFGMATGAISAGPYCPATNSESPGVKILQLVQKPQRRGAEVFAFQLTSQLRRNQHDVRIAYLYPYEGSARLPIDPSEVLLQGNERSIFEKIPGYHPWLLDRLRELIQEFQPNIVQANGARTVKYAAFAKRSKNAPPPVVIYRSIGNPEDWLRGALRKFFYRRFVMPKIDGVVGVSKATLKNVVSFYNLSVPYTQIPRGINLDALMPQRQSAEVRKEAQTSMKAKVMSFVGSLTREKRPDRFLRVLDQVRRSTSDVKAWIVGDGPLMPELLRQVKEADLGSYVYFWGGQSDVASILNASDLLLLTSDTEGIPGVLLEAGALRIPAVAPAVGGVSECILDGETGVITEPGAESTMAEIVSGLLQDSARRSMMGEKARAWVEENFGIEKVALQYQKFYETVCGSQRRHLVDG